MGAVVSQQGLRLLVPASGLDDSVKLLLAHRLAIIAPASDTLSARTPHSHRPHGPTTGKNQHA
jgi:hypothetical protein